MFRTTYVAALSLLLLTSAALAGPVHDAAAAGDVAEVTRLIKSGVSANELNEAGETPLIVAARTDQKEVANVLMQLGADTAVATPDGQTALHAAALQNDANLIYVLFQAPTDVNVKDKDGTTALMLAAEAGMANSVVALRGDWHADLEVTDNDGRTALTRAGIKRQKIVVTILLRYRAVCQTSDVAWHDACEARKAELKLK